MAEISKMILFYENMFCEHPIRYIKQIFGMSRYFLIRQCLKKNCAFWTTLTGGCHINFLFKSAKYKYFRFDISYKADFLFDCLIFAAVWLKYIFEIFGPP
jgi:hypothetical protein